jgi:hypothetical protein
MLRAVLGWTIAVALASVFVASAGGFGVVSDTVQAGDDYELRCDLDGVSLSFDVVWNGNTHVFDMTALHINGIDQPACKNKQLKVRLLWNGFGDTILSTQTDTSSDFTFVLAAPRPAEKLIGWAIALHDGPP